MTDSVFTAITFSPVTEFIEKTRKLRDLYGSSFILSYLAEAVCRKAQQQLGADAVVSPALLNTTMGTPDQIIIAGDFSEESARNAFLSAWGTIMDACRNWICQNCDYWIDTSYSKWVANGEWHKSRSRALPWNREWQHWKNHAWEFFWVQGTTIPNVLDALAEAERNRNWVGVNWMGESSTLSGVDAIAWPGLGLKIPAKQYRMAEADSQIRDFFEIVNLKIGEAILEDDLFYHQRNLDARLKKLAERYAVDFEQPSFKQELAKKLGEAIVTNREQLSILELTKRLFTLTAVAETVPNSEQLQQELPASFRDVNLWTTDQPMGWFRGDGDRAGQYIRQITQGEDAVEQLHHFSHQMRQWGTSLKQNFDLRLGRIIFAGGDDFLGLFYPSKQPTFALDWLYQFKENVWHRGENDQPDPKPITPRLGFVWASPKVPQREVLQQCELAERSAKDSGRDRVALRVLFNGGNYLEWVCPWHFLPVLQDYHDRDGQQNWAHLFNDVAVLEARHAFQGKDDKGKPVNDRLEVALALFNVYFKATHTLDASTTAWNEPDHQAFYNLMAIEGQDCNAPDYWEQDGLWNSEESFDPSAPTKKRLKGGLLGDRAAHTKDHQPDGDLDLSKTRQALTAWMINLAKVGFHLCSDI